MKFIKRVLTPDKQSRAVYCRYVVSVVSVVMLLWSCFIVAGCGNQEDRTSMSKKQRMNKGKIAGSENTSRSDASSVPAEAVAIVNGQEIAADELAQRLQLAIQQGDNSSPPDEYTLNRLREEALTELIEKTLIEQKAKEQQISVTDEEFDQLVQQVQREYDGKDIQNILQEQDKSYEVWAKEQREKLLLEKLIDANMGSMIVVSPEEVRQYYERNKEKYDHPAQIRASQILTYEENIARKALQEIQSGKDFAKVAVAYSESADAKNGGDLGFFAKGVMPPEFDEVIFPMKMGEVSDVVNTPYGYQIFKLTGRREAHRVELDEVKGQIEHLLEKQKRMLAVDLWMAELQNNAKIVLNHHVIKQVN